MRDPRYPRLEDVAAWYWKARFPRANQGRGLRAPVSPQMREEARLPRLAGNQGSELTGADALAADDPEGRETGENEGRSGRPIASVRSLR
jgi:hypothetical protein